MVLSILFKCIHEMYEKHFFGDNCFYYIKTWIYLLFQVKFWFTESSVVKQRGYLDLNTHFLVVTLRCAQRSVSRLSFTMYIIIILRNYDKEAIYVIHFQWKFIPSISYLSFWISIWLWKEKMFILHIIFNSLYWIRYFRSKN